MPKKGYKRTKEHELHRYKSRTSWKRNKSAKEAISLALKGHQVSDRTKLHIKEKNELKIYQTMKLEEHMYLVHGKEKWLNRREKHLKCELCKWTAPKEVNKEEQKRYAFQRAQALKPVQEQLKEADDAITKAVLEASK